MSMTSFLVVTIFASHPVTVGCEESKVFSVFCGTAIVENNRSFCSYWNRFSHLKVERKDL
jgi:hypothetical protein